MEMEMETTTMQTRVVAVAINVQPKSGPEPEPEPEPESHTCYVCLEEGTDLLSPCGCAWLRVHRACLVNMVTASAPKSTCSVCKQQFRNVTTVTEEVRLVNRPEALLMLGLLCGAMTTGLLFLYMLQQLVVGGEKKASIALAVLGFVCLASSMGSCIGARKLSVVRVETHTRSVVIG